MAGLLALALGGAGLVALPQVAASPAAAAPACRAEAADEVLAAKLAAQCSARVEVLSERTESAQTFVEPDGRRRLVASAVPQRIRRANGSWADISAGLVRQADGSLRPAATLADVTFSGGGDGPLVTWREAGQSFTLSWPLGRLPVPRVSGAAAVYESVLPGVNLHLVATAEGYRHAVEVLTAAAAASPAVRELRYTTGGDLRVKANTDGGLRLVDSRGRAVATSVPSRMWDSSTDASYAGEVLPEVAAAWAAGAARPVVAPATAAEPAATSRSAPVAVSVGAGEIRVAADAAFLADPKVTYPVFVDPPFEKQRAKWAYATSNGENNNNEHARVGNNPETAGTYRSFYDFDVSGLKGKQVLSGTVRITLDHSFSCTPTWVHLYKTSAITVSSAGRMAWTTRPLPSGVWLDSWEGNANEAGGCGSIQPDKDAEFVGTNVKNQLQAVANSTSNTFTVGLCACNEEGGYETTEDRWKRFYTDKAWVEVVYNSVPATPSNLTTSGQACGATIGTSSPVFKAYYGDADAAADSLTGYFEYQQTAPTLGTVTAKTGQTKPGNAYGDSGTIVLGSAAEGKTYQWRVKTKDATGAESNPVWSAWCAFTVDADAPPMPGVSSPLYLDDDLAHGGPGEAGTFNFTANASDVVKYVFGWDGSPEPMTTVTVTAGAGYSKSLTPPRHGYNTLNVYTMDSANKQSPVKPYRFLVGSPDAPVAHWPLDTFDAHNFNDQIGTAHLEPLGNPTMAADARIIGEGVASFDGASRLRTTVPVLNPMNSYSVSAWVKLGDRGDALPTTWHAAVVQDGDVVDSFVLGYKGATEQKWGFWLHGSDAGSAQTIAQVLGPKPVMGRWTHLTGVYDKQANRIRLYVDGTLAASGTLTTAPAWSTARAVAIGREQWNGNAGQYWDGQIADVRLWQRVVGTDDLVGTLDNPAQGTQAVPGILQPTEVASWDFNGALDGVCGSVASASYWQQYLDLGENTCTDPYSATQTGGYTGDDHDNNDALWLNQPQPEGHGTAGTGYAATTAPIVRTDQSVTVSAWAKVDIAKGTDQTVFSLCGDHQCALWLKYYPDIQSWQAIATEYDDAGGSPLQVAETYTPATGEWTHLALVYDAVTSELRLFVNGERADTTVLTFTPFHAASGGLNIGRTKYDDTWVDHLSGIVDQVKVTAGALTDREIKAVYQNS